MSRGALGLAALAIHLFWNVFDIGARHVGLLLVQCAEGRRSQRPCRHRVISLFLDIVHFLIVFEDVWVELISLWLRSPPAALSSLLRGMQGSRAVHHEVTVLSLGVIGSLCCLTVGQGHPWLAFIGVLFVGRLLRQSVRLSLLLELQRLEQRSVGSLFKALADDDFVPGPSLALWRSDAVL